MVWDWIKRVRVKTLFIELGSPWENGYNESFNGKFRDELLKGGRNTDKTVAKGVQHSSTPQLTWIPLLPSA